MTERRRQGRQTAQLVLDMEAPGGTRWAGITKDISPLGALVMTNVRLEEGYRVHLKVVHPGQPKSDLERSTLPDAVVRRVDSLPDGAWPLAVALEFEDPVEEPLDSLLSAADVSRRSYC
jgi:hypothetical protein